MKISKHVFRLAEKFRVSHGKSFRLKDFDPADTAGLHSKEQAEEFLQQSIAVLNDLQEKLYAQDQWAVLLIFQAMDAAGKDGVIKHVMSGINPQGCQVVSFKQPSSEELNHDYMWRAARALPERGRIGIFNRSYYEEVLVVRVHQELLAKQHLPLGLVTKGIWKERFEDIHAFERYLSHNGVVVRKFFLHVSKEAQQQRFLKRLEEPEKNWKFSDSDVQERQHWESYMSAYNDLICHTATPAAPWYVVPADHKYVTHAVVCAAVIETLQDLKLSFPQVDPKRRKDLEAVRAALEKKSHPRK
ncbi:MAG TPA: polyphosphate kinase 2 family protein [Candidatus Saccharimonadales bacterium]|jgi:PPK2 family polyphosphate:nucleotide phosphotransferase|nr:polyphosphate kinase 2 family protein [Candidatus Saccharimonadales bacterium]